MLTLLAQTWKNSSLISDTEAKVFLNCFSLILLSLNSPIPNLQELKDEYFTNLASNKDTSKDQSSKVAVATKNDVVAPLPTATMQSKTKPKLKKKVVDDPFASEDEAVDNDKEKPKEGIQAKVVKKKPLPRKKAAVDAFVSDEEKNEDAKPQKKTKLTSIVKKRQASDVESDEESDERPKKKSTKSG
ncbi:hypothetical protein H0H87_008268 [Tephrocybe sp. NHM501043]|nr:hypothetical protein H0H87_008268 [Tephrocybe sp. NHM501043]